MRRAALLLPLLLLALIPLRGCLVSGPALAPAAARQASPPTPVPPAEKGVRYQRFLVLGDWGTGTKSQQAVADSMSARIKAAKGAWKLDFVLTTGDNFYPRGVSSATDPLFKTHFEGVYNTPELKAPLYPTLGNHDHMGNWKAQIAYSKLNPRWRMPAPYYSFTRKVGKAGAEQSVEFFALDTEALHRRSQARPQLDWFEAKLKASKATWKIVFGHHPLYSHSVRPYNYLMIQRLEALFKTYKVDLYMAGHDHVLEMLKPVGGVNYLVSGGGAGPRRAYPSYKTDKSHFAVTGGGFVFCRLGPKELVLEFIQLKGQAVYTHVLKKPGVPKAKAKAKGPRKYFK